MNDDLFQLGERIVELAARINIATCEMLTLIAEFDRREGWADEFTSCAEWLAVTTGRTLGTARENVRVAHALEELPLTSAEMKTGKLSYTKVRTMTRVATPETEKTLLKYARAGSAAKLEQIVRGWKHLSRDWSPSEQGSPWQKSPLHSTGAASRLDATLCVAPRSNGAAILTRRSLPAGRFAGLGADAGFRRERWQRGSVENPGRVPSGSRWRSTPRWPRWRRTGNRAAPRSTG